MELGEIYIIKNTVNSKVYIGQTNETVKVRFRKHLSAARTGKGYVIGKAMRKYGLEKFYVELLEAREFSNRKELTQWANARETYWIAYYKANNPKFGYNMSIGGNVVRTTKDLDEEQVIAMFNSGKGSWQIAKELHVHPYRTAEILKKHNIVYGIDKQRRSDEKDIVQAYTSGLGTMDICRKSGINKSTVRRILLRNNITLRRRARNKNSERNPQTSIR